MNFVEEYFKNVHRAFDGRLAEIFHRLKKTEFADITTSVREVENAEDNACAMYITPVALFCSKNPKSKIEDVIKEAVSVTHMHENSLNGAILQAKAITHLLNANCDLDFDEYLGNLIESMRNTASYPTQLENVRKLLRIDDPSEEKVVNLLGHSSLALYSVPTAIYCFLRSVKQKNSVCDQIRKKKIIISPIFNFFSN